MRFDIENKILFPFIILFILSIITLGMVSYWNGYQLLLKNEVKNLSKNLDEMVFYIENIQESIDEGTLTEKEGQTMVLNFYSRAKKDNLIIFDKGRVLLSDFDKGQEWIEILKNENLEEEQQQVSIGNHMLTYKTYDPWGWVLGYRLNKGIFSFEVLESQKYMVLVAIVCLLFSMQATIFIAYNISKPIKLLADICNKIAQGNFKEKIDIKRKDEIGILADAFNNMVNRLQINTTKLLNITRLNEDILGSVSTGIITTDQHGKILSMNKAAKSLLSREEEKNIAYDIKEKLLHQLNNTLETNENINIVHTFDNIQEGSKIYLDATTSLLKADEDLASGVICNFNDISERKKIENNMVTLDRLTSIGKLASGIAHEIRNPLAGMKTSIQVLKNRLCKDTSGSNKKLFNGVLYEIDRINNLITGILNFAKPRMPKYEKVDLMEVLDGALNLVNKTPEKKNIDINIFKHCSNSFVYVDKDQVIQIFLNIIQNSFAAMHKENGVFSITIDNHNIENRPFLGIEFHDNGCGIEPKNLDKIYDPFYTTKGQGTGLGLSVVYELIKGNNGKVEVLSNLDIGTKFIIYFPICGGEMSE